MQLARILVGVDLTTPSMEAAVWAARRFAPHAEVTLAHCISPLLSERRVIEERSLAEVRLQELNERVGPERCSHRVLVGDPARSLAALAAELDADVVAVGAHESHPDRDPALGTTAQQLIRCSSVPVLLCCEMPFGAPRSMLLPLHAPEVSAAVADWTSTLAQRFESRLALVHVETQSDGAGRRASHSRRGRPLTTTPWNRVARELPPQRVFVDAVSGDAAKAVLEEARRFSTELVMLEAPDEEPTETPATSVDAMLVQSHCPVLVIPATDDLS